MRHGLPSMARSVSSAMAYCHFGNETLTRSRSPMTQRSLLFCACARSAMLCWDEVLIDVALNRYKLVYA
jgi:hypothetical protein